MSENDGIGPLLRLAGARELVPDEVEARARAGAVKAWRSTLGRRTRRRRAALAISLAVVVAAIIAGRHLVPAPRPPEAARVEVASGRGPLTVGALVRNGGLVATAGERLALRLSSGAGVRIDRDSRLRVQNGSSLHLLEGAVYVVSAAGGSVEVHTPLGSVRHVGTRFEVRRLSHAVRIRVREGRAYLLGTRGRHDVATGEELLADEKADPERRRVDLTGAEWDWTAEVAPPFSVDRRTLAAFLVWFSAETGRAVRFADPALSRQAERMVLRGSVSDLTPHEALEAVLPAVGLRAYRSGEHVEVRRGTR